LAWFSAKVSKPKHGVPPFGHRTQLRVFVDPDLLKYDEVRAAAGTWNDNFGANPIYIVRVSGGVVTTSSGINHTICSTK
jgi:prolyl-tRNA editing enzyme YbaK/EbsC (Cys-tRNA(Pro) deacylase)